ncbi:MAG TPA: tetratricopeptide repeat protein [Anaerolineae bacterium]|nr:tetratricopeptide repeat protein [Anaerolineae bacterium]HOR01052.1 tetratricopeptide repeat protein [Anaerolineae bacterium]HPL27091.1 tetratricopeptide repeat protein [Anaerolineae bacterium]
MDPYLVLALVLLLFAAAAAGPSLLGRERLAWSCAGEILLWGILLLAAAWAVRLPSPFVYLVALYLVTMRARLLVDAANLIAARRHPLAFALYTLALHVALNPLDRASVQINRGAALLHSGRAAEAVAELERVLACQRLGPRLEAAVRCNLGLAYLQQGDLQSSRAELQQAAAALPSSVYGQRARVALQRLEAPQAEG